MPTLKKNKRAVFFSKTHIRILNNLSIFVKKCQIMLDTLISIGGHTLSLKDLYSILKSLNISLDILAKPQTDLPLLLHYGRADMTVSFFGANISPTDVNEAIYSIPELSEIVNSYNLSINEDKEGTKKLIISLEVQKGETTELVDLEKIKTTFFENLSKINQDFREVIKMLPNTSLTVLCFENFGSGSFKENDIRIKAKYIN